MDTHNPNETMTSESFRLIPAEKRCTSDIVTFVDKGNLEITVIVNTKFALQDARPPNLASVILKSDKLLINVAFLFT
jgi:hypothetical protein